MRYLASIFLMLLIAGAAVADITVNVVIPDSAGALGNQMCSYIRVQEQASTTTWTTAKCGEVLMRRGMLATGVDITRQLGRSATIDSVNSFVSGFDTDFPLEIDPACGDGVVDADLGEECDSTPGCDLNCLLE